jgi:hypothetical protein
VSTSSPDDQAKKTRLKELTRIPIYEGFVTLPRWDTTKGTWVPREESVGLSLDIESVESKIKEMIQTSLYGDPIVVVNQDEVETELERDWRFEGNRPGRVTRVADYFSILSARIRVFAIRGLVDSHNAREYAELTAPPKPAPFTEIVSVVDAEDLDLDDLPF